jgi:manganese/zinc/iron transport system substrate-binding protein
MVCQLYYDPHVWFDVPLWSKCANKVAEGLGEFDPGHKAIYEKRAVELQKKMEGLHQWALKKAAELPKEKRVVITSHDAFNYFGRAYDFQVVGLQGISTVTEAGVADMAKMVDFIKKTKVPAVFVESSVAHATMTGNHRATLANARTRATSVAANATPQTASKAAAFAGVRMSEPMPIPK